MAESKTYSTCAAVTLSMRWSALDGVAVVMCDSQQNNVSSGWSVDVGFARRGFVLDPGGQLGSDLRY